MLGRHQPEVGADRGAGEPVPVADLHRQPEPGQGGDPTQAAQPAHDRVNSLSAAISAIALSSRSRRPRSAAPPRSRPRTPAARPGAVERAARAARRRGPGPGLPAGVDDAVAQQQLGQPVPGPHQIAAGVLPGPDQVPGRLLLDVGTRTSTISSSRSSRASSIASRASVLTRSPAGRCSFDGAATTHRHPARGQTPGQPEPGRARLVDHRAPAPAAPRPTQITARIRGQPAPMTSPVTAVDRACHHRPGVHIQPDTRTLMITGASRNCGSTGRPKPARQPTSTCERGLSLLIPSRPGSPASAAGRAGPVRA